MISWKAGSAQALYDLKQYEEAIQLTNELVASQPDSSSYLLLQTNIFIQLQKQSEAITNLEWLRRSRGLDTPSALLLTNLHIQQNNEEMVVDLLGELASSPEEGSVNGVLNAVDNALTQGISLNLKEVIGSLADLELKEGETQKLERLQARNLAKFDHS